MKHLITILLLFFAVLSFAQNQYYSTNGKNRLTKDEAEELLSQYVDKMSNLLNKQMYGSLKVTATETKSDSIISTVTFLLDENKGNEPISKDYLSDYVDKEFPAFELNTLTGTNFNSEQLKGKPTMINLWFTKCPPCIEEMPVLNTIKEKYKDDLNFISITYESEESVRKFLTVHTFDFTHLVNAQSFTDELRIQAYPMNLFLDENGVLKYVKGGIPYIFKEGEKLKMGEGNEIIEIIEKIKL
ncbi:MAG: TlpA family protein disulfide reductase [Saprospiraceae bacterium]|nr:TlpA family protein disulfide reductase [Saprospiraceae bacterium]